MTTLGTDFSSRVPTLLLVMLASAALVACGGGGSGSGGGGGGGGSDDDEDATGIWTGTLQPDGATSVPAVVVAVPDGSFALFAGAAGFYYGTGTTDGTGFSASATGFAIPGDTFANGSASGAFSFSGTVFEAATLSGSYSGAGESGTLSLDFNAGLTNRAASLALVNGSYADQSNVGSISFNNGAITFAATSGTNCLGNGTIRLADTASRNLYQWDLTLSGCINNGAFDGVAFLADVNGGTNNQIVMLGASGASPFVGVFSK